MATTMRPKKVERHKFYGRATDEQKAIIDEIIERSRGRSGQVDIMSAALDLYCWAAERYPVGLDLVPQLPGMTNTKPPLLKKKSRIA